MKHISKRILACALALLLCLGLGSVAVVAADAAEITVTVSLSDGSGFYIVPGSKFVVASETAESYGYDDAFNGEKVSALDAVIAAFAAIFDGDAGDIHSNLVMSGGMIMDFMGHGYNFGYLVNGVLADVGVTDFELKNNDTVDLRALNDSMAMDNFTWFEYGGKKTEKIQAVVNKPVELTLMGISAFTWGDWGAFPEEAVADADVVLIDLEDSGFGYDYGFLGGVLGVTDNDGIVVITFNKAGNYVLSAIGEDDYGSPLMNPWLVVTVTNPGSDPLPPAKTAAKAALDSYKDAADYREEQKTELAAAITAGKTAIDAATTTAGVDAALAAAKEAIDAIKTDAQLTAELAQAKTDAKAALDSYMDPADYRAAQKDELAAAIAAGKAAIDAGTTEAGVNEALAAAEEAIDAIKTDAQLTAEELTQAKTEAKADLDTYKNAAGYRDAQKTELAAAIAAGKAAIDAATTEAGVNIALLNAKTAMDAIKTDAQLKVEESLLGRWRAKLPDWMGGVVHLWDFWQYVILFAGFGWVWFLF